MTLTSDVLIKHDNLPDDVKKQLKRSGAITRTHYSYVLTLFDHKSELSIDDIILGLYNIYQVKRSRSWVRCAMYFMRAASRVSQAPGKRGLYIKLGD